MPDPADSPPSGCLYVVGTPIGNRDDITLRALKTLASADLVAAEDTRHTGRLLAHHGIDAKLTAYHEHNEETLTPRLLQRLQRGETIALVSDAGTPGVADPGYRLLSAATEAGIRVVPIPGVSAVVTALSVAGLPTDAFLFAGFPARKKNRRREQLEVLGGLRQTVVFYESPHRIGALLEQLKAVWGARRAVLCREMTKLHEEFIRGSLSDIAAELRRRSRIRGECTLLVAGRRSEDAVPWQEVREALRRRLASGEGLAAVSRTVARRCGLPRARVYAEALQVRKELAGAGDHRSEGEGYGDAPAP
jgi:16S rRNA (cytidine1402-2'-O)-methyltransferase